MKGTADQIARNSYANDYITYGSNAQCYTTAEDIDFLNLSNEYYHYYLDDIWQIWEIKQGKKYLKTMMCLTSKLPLPLNCKLLTLILILNCCYKKVFYHS